MKRRKRFKRKIKRLIERIPYILGAIVFIWFILSWAEVTTHSMDDHYDYWDSNMFVMMTESLVEE